MYLFRISNIGVHFHHMEDICKTQIMHCTYMILNYKHTHTQQINITIVFAKSKYHNDCATDAIPFAIPVHVCTCQIA